MDPTLSFEVFERVIHSGISRQFEMFKTNINSLINRQNHGFETAHHSLTEKWCKNLDNHKTVGIMSMNSFKAFDSIPCVFLICKLKEYGAYERAFKLLEDYLTERTQRVKLADIRSTS